MLVSEHFVQTSWPQRKQTPVPLASSEYGRLQVTQTETLEVQVAQGLAQRTQEPLPPVMRRERGGVQAVQLELVTSQVEQRVALQATQLVEERKYPSSQEEHAEPVQDPQWAGQFSQALAVVLRAYLAGQVSQIAILAAV